MACTINRAQLMFTPARLASALGLIGKRQRKLSDIGAPANCRESSLLNFGVNLLSRWFLAGFGNPVWEPVNARYGQEISCRSDDFCLIGFASPRGAQAVCGQKEILRGVT